MTLFEQFCDTLQRLTDTVRAVTDIEQKRLDAATDKQHDRIHTFLNDEQAALLNLRGLDQKRSHQAEALGWKDLTYTQILDAATEEERVALTPLFDTLNRELSLLKEVRENADRMVHVRIHELEELIALAGGLPSGTSSNNLFHDKYV